MNDNKTAKACKFILFAAALAAAGTGSAETIVHGFHGQTIQTVIRHVPLSDPNDPFHDTYKKNTGQIRREAPKPVRNLQAKISAAQADALRLEQKRDQAARSPISCYSNITAPKRTPAAPAAPAGSAPAERTINIYNSSVVINQ